jgi:hypothetical protein
MSGKLRAFIDGGSVDLPTKVHLLWWQKRGLSFTASGYGKRIPTSYMVQLPGSPRWRRVYCTIYGNSGTCYVGKSIRDGVVVDGPW